MDQALGAGRPPCASYLGSCVRRRSAAASSDSVRAGAAAHRARLQGVIDAEQGLVLGDARHAGRQRRPVDARLLAGAAANRAQGRSARCGAELRFLGWEGAEVTAVVPSRASNAVAVLHVRRGARLGGFIALGRVLALLLARLPALLGALLALAMVETVEVGVPTHADFDEAVLVADRVLALLLAKLLARLATNIYF